MVDQNEVKCSRTKYCLSQRWVAIILHVTSLIMLSYALTAGDLFVEKSLAPSNITFIVGLVVGCLAWTYTIKAKEWFGDDKLGGKSSTNMSCIFGPLFLLLAFSGLPAVFTHIENDVVTGQFTEIAGKVGIGMTSCVFVYDIFESICGDGFGKKINIDTFIGFLKFPLFCLLKPIGAFFGCLGRGCGYHGGTGIYWRFLSSWRGFFDEEKKGSSKTFFRANNNDYDRNVKEKRHGASNNKMLLNGQHDIYGFGLPLKSNAANGPASQKNDNLDKAERGKPMSSTGLHPRKRRVIGTKPGGAKKHSIPHEDPLCDDEKAPELLGSDVKSVQKYSKYVTEDYYKSLNEVRRRLSATARLARSETVKSA